MHEILKRKLVHQELPNLKKKDFKFKLGYIFNAFNKSDKMWNILSESTFPVSESSIS